MKIEIEIEQADLDRYGAILDQSALNRVFNEAFHRLIGSPELCPSLPEDETALLDAAGLEAPTDGKAIASAARDSAAIQAELVASALTVEQVANSFGVNQSRIRQRIKARELFAVRDGNRWCLPLFQFQARGADVAPVPNAFRVLPQVPEDLAPVAVASWFTLPNDELFPGEGDHPEVPLSPKDWLVQGFPAEPVMELAAQLAGEPMGRRADRRAQLLAELDEMIAQLESAGGEDIDGLVSAFEQLLEKTEDQSTG